MENLNRKNLEKEYQRKYRELNKEKIKNWKKAYEEKNKEKILRQKRELYQKLKKENPEKLRQLHINRREYMQNRRKTFSGNPNIKGKPWTQEEYDILLSGINETEMVKILGRSLISIQQRKWKLRHHIKPKMIENFEDILLERYEKEDLEEL